MALWSRVLASGCRALASWSRALASRSRVLASWSRVLASWSRPLASWSRVLPSAVGRVGSTHDSNPAGQLLKVSCLPFYRCLFAVGGRDEDELLDSVERYDPRLNVWSLVAPLPHKMRCMSSVSYKGKLFVFGGEMSTEITNTAHWYQSLT